MGGLLRSELFRLSKRPMPWIMLTILTALVLLLYGIQWVQIETQPARETAGLRQDVRPVEVPGFAIGGFLSLFGTVMAIVLGASAVGTEFGWGTIRALLPRARGRVPLLLAKMVAVALVLAAMVSLVSLLALGLSAIVTGRVGVDGGTDAGFAADFVAAVARVFYTMLPYAAVAFLVALLTRSNAAGITIGIVFLPAEGILLELIALVDALEWVPEAFLSENVEAVNTASDDEAREGLPGAGRAAAVLLAWIVGALALALAVFRRRDVTSG